MFASQARERARFDCRMSIDDFSDFLESYAISNIERAGAFLLPKLRQVFFVSSQVIVQDLFRNTYVCDHRVE
jgi:hypothetical protein